MTMQMRANHELDSASFRAIADLAYRESGLTLVEEKTTMIQSRLRHRLRALGLADFRSYCDLIESDAGSAERQHLISALTTNVSHFFREEHHFTALRHQVDQALPRLRAGEPVRIWSAGSSNGQEAYSTAMSLLEYAPELADLDLRILGTDIDRKVVQFARTGRYPARMLDGVSVDMRKKYFMGHGDATGQMDFEVTAELKRLISFNYLNLLGPWPMQRRFDAIFCRNVVIYFDLETQNRLWPRFRAALKPGGILFLGHSERISDPAAFGFECTDPTTYRLS